MFSAFASRTFCALVAIVGPRGDFARSRVLVLVVAMLCLAADATAGLARMHGHIYASRDATITQYDQQGERVAQITVAGGDLRGIAFYGDRLLAVQNRLPPQLSRLLIIDPANGDIISSRDIPGPTNWNMSSGKIHVARDGRILVATMTGIFRLDTPTGVPERFLDAGYDVTELRDGSFLVAEDYGLARYSASGLLIEEAGRTVNEAGVERTLFTNLRGVHWSEPTSTIYVTMLGSSGDPFQIISLRPSGYVETLKTSHNYADDLADGAGDFLAVGSRTLAPAIVDPRLRVVRSVNGPAALFITTFRLPDPIFSASFDEQDPSQ